MAAAFSTACVAQAPVSRVGGSGSVNERLAELERGISARSQAQITQQRQMTSLQREVSELRGLLEEQAHLLEQVVNRQRDVLLKLQDTTDSSASSRPDEGVSKPIAASRVTNKNQDEKAKPTPSANTNTSHGTEKEAYDNAVHLVLQEKDYDAAIPAFARFITQYPESSYVPNSHYWLGQMLFAQKRFDQSKAQFARVAEAYPKSNKRAESLVKLGLIAQQQSDNGQARQYFEQVISEYGNSVAAQQAQKGLADL